MSLKASGRERQTLVRQTGKGLPLRLPQTLSVSPDRHFRPANPNWHAGCFIRLDASFGEETMMSGNDLFGVHGAALAVRSARMGVLASNIANASTPGFKARDVDFRQALAAAGSDAGITAATKYRVPLQTTLDGNTVELSQEQTAFAENAVQYQTTLSFLNGRIATLTRALKGE
jgi:flagellar basal-body rod protein FlgB